MINENLFVLQTWRARRWINRANATGMLKNTLEREEGALMN